MPGSRATALSGKPCSMTRSRHHPASAAAVSRPPERAVVERDQVVTCRFLTRGLVEVAPPPPQNLAVGLINDRPRSWWRVGGVILDQDQGTAFVAPPWPTSEKNRSMSGRCSSTSTAYAEAIDDSAASSGPGSRHLTTGPDVAACARSSPDQSQPTTRAFEKRSHDLALATPQVEDGSVGHTQQVCHQRHDVLEIRRIGDFTSSSHQPAAESHSAVSSFRVPGPLAGTCRCRTPTRRPLPPVCPGRRCGPLRRRLLVQGRSASPRP